MAIPENHDFPDRRAPQPAPFTWIDMDAHMDRKLESIHGKLDTLLETMESSVPNGDFAAHRREHEHWREEVAERKKARQEFWKEAMKWAVQAIGAGLVFIFISGIQSQFGKPPAAIDTPRATVEIHK